MQAPSATSSPYDSAPATSSHLTVIISGYSFRLAAPYRAGSVLTLAEAQALNALRAERVQTNVRQIVQRATAVLAQGELLAPGQVESVQTAITDYDSRFAFVERHEPRPRLSALDREVELIAIEQAKAAHRRLAPEAHSAEQFEQLVTNYRKATWVQDEARRRIAAKTALVVDGDPLSLL